MDSYPLLFTPLKIKNITFKNRIFAPPNLIGFLSPDDYPTDYMVSYYEEKAKGGAALVTVGCTPVDQKNAPDHDMLHFDRKAMPWYMEMAKAIKRYGAVASVELDHAGQYIFPEYRGYPPIGPTGFVRDDGIEVIEMDERMIEEVVNSFGHTAKMVRDAGFDMCMVHGGHGWLIHQFLSPHFNKRTDDFGGSLENRARFALMVLDRIRAETGPDFLIEFRMSGNDFLGFDLNDSIPFAKMLEGKVDLIHVSAGVDLIEDLHIITHSLTFLPHGVNIKYAEAIRAEVNTPVVGIGGISSPEFAEKLLQDGKVDAVAVARGLIADPYFPLKARLGRAEDIRPCLRCLRCLGTLQEKLNSGCAINPRAGREFRLSLENRKAITPKRVFIVGGGPAGIQAAITASERGHEVILAEKSGALGGILKYTDNDDLKEDLHLYKEYLVRQVMKNPKIDVRLNTCVNAEMVHKIAPDALIVAVGSSPIIPQIPGIDLPHVKTTLEMYESIDTAGKNVVVIGGGLAGVELATALGRKGRTVTVVEALPELNIGSDWRYWKSLLKETDKSDVTILTGTSCISIHESGIDVKDDTGRKYTLPADTVVNSVGMRANSDVVEELRGTAFDFFPVGDCVKARLIEDAVHEGFFAASSITEYP